LPFPFSLLPKKQPRALLKAQRATRSAAKPPMYDNRLAYCKNFARVCRRWIQRQMHRQLLLRSAAPRQVKFKSSPFPSDSAAF